MIADATTTELCICAEFGRTRASGLIHPRSQILLFVALALAGHCSAFAAELTPASSPATAGLSFSVGARGLDSLTFNGHKLIASPRSGELEPAKSFVASAFGNLLQRQPAATATPRPANDTVELTFPWGRVTCTYGAMHDALLLKLDVTNNGAEAIGELPLRLMELTFPTVPTAKTLDAGMFGFGFKGEAHPLPEYPLVADHTYVAPIIEVNFGADTLNFCSDDLESALGIPFATNPITGTTYPFILTGRAIEPGQTKTFRASLRFSSPHKAISDLSADVVRRYGERHPFQLNWPDRRPIGMIFLASSGVKEPGNPRRWIMNNGKVDVSTVAGKASFRAMLLKWADATIEILKDVGAQGMITWDPEGQEFAQSVYYGDPRLTATLAPETEFKSSEDARSAIDEYFAKFRAAGLKVGVCIRPQQIAVNDGKPVQGVADNEHAAAILKEKLTYAKNRWGCTLFYVDSTVDRNHLPLDPAVFEEAARANPDVLLMPENESLRYYSCSAPLNSYVHHRITATPAGARVVYPKSFSVLMAADADRLEDQAALTAAIRRGDILLFNCWYRHPGIDRIRQVYRDASSSIP